jgi:hypothetical protein
MLQPRATRLKLLSFELTCEVKFRELAFNLSRRAMLRERVSYEAVVNNE